MAYIPPEVIDWWKSDPALRNTYTGVPNGNPLHPATNQNIIDLFRSVHANKLGVVVDRKTIVFLWPGIRLNGWAAQFYKINIESTSMNHGLAGISAVVKRMGYKTFLVDLRRCHGWEEVEGFFQKMNPFALLVGFQSIDEDDTLKAISLFRKNQPNVPIIVGGVHVSVVRKPIEGCTTVFGEGENTIVRLIEMLERGEKLPETVEGETVQNLDALPFVDRNLFDQSIENNHPFLGGMPVPFYTINFGRGCYFKRCSFCHESFVHMPKYRVRSPERCITEIARLDPGSLMVHDDIFPPAKWCREFIYLWKERIRRRIPFWCQMRADFVVANEDLIRELSEIGLTWVSLGVESGSQRILDFLDKGTTVEENYKAIAILQKYNVNIWCNLIFSVPTETREDVEATVKLIRETHPTQFSLSTYTCYPNSKLYQYCIDNDLFLNEHYAMQHYPYHRKIKGIDYNWLFGRIGEVSTLQGQFRNYTGPNVFPEKKGIKITCITLSHNRPSLLLNAFLSLKAQTFKNFEWLVLDDSTSTPEMENILSEIEKDTRSKIIKVHDTSLSRMWNKGIDLAKGDYICTLDDDNWKEPTFMEEMSRTLDENIQFDAVACPFICVDEVNVTKWTSGLPDLEHLKSYNTIDGGALMFRKSIVERIGWFDERINTSEDWDYVLRIHHQSNGFKIVPIPLTGYRRHLGNRMLQQEQLGHVKDRQFMISKKYDRTFKVYYYKEHYGTLTQSQKTVIESIEDALMRVNGVEMVDRGAAELTIVPGPFMVNEKFNTPILPIHMEDPYATNNIRFAQEHKDFIVALTTNELGFVKTYDDIIGRGKTIYCPILGVNDLKIDLLDQPKDRDIDILFLGYPYPSRAFVAHQVYSDLGSQYKILFVGDKWEEYFPKEICHVTTDDREAMSLMRRAKVVVVSERIAGDLGDQISDTWHRGYFECASGAAVVLYCPVIKNHNFGNEVTITSTVTDLIYNIRDLLENPQVQEKKGKKAWERAISTYTYRVRIRKIIQAVRSQRFFFRVE